MPNAIKYSTSAQTLALKKGNYWIGTGDVGKGPTSTTDYWNGITPPSGGYTIYLNKASSGPSIYTAANDSQLISLSNTIAGQTFATAAAALAWFATQTDKMIFNIDYPAIVTNGLVLNLDAGFTPSYPKTATTWYDVSSGGNNGTLTNGPTFSSTDGGSIVFDGVDDYVNIPDNSVLDFTGSVNLTSEVWIKFNLYKDISFVNAKGDGGGGVNNYNYFFIGTNVAFYFRFSNGTTSQSSPIIGSSTLPTGSWGHVVGVLDTSAIRIYLNGTEIGTATARTINPAANNSPFYISTPSYALNGSVGASRIYNRALTASEVLQNYNATKSRFGL